MAPRKNRKRYRYYKKFVKSNFHDNAARKKRRAPFFWAYDIINQNWDLLLAQQQLKPSNYSKYDHLVRYLLVDNLGLRLKNPPVWNDVLLPKIKKFMSEKNIPLFRTNYEGILTKNEKLAAEEREKYFQFHNFYQLVGSIFAAPFKGKEKFLFYKYGYLLTMFLVLSIFVNIDRTPSSQIPFMVKILGYKTAIYTLQLIDSHDFNEAIILTNKKMKNINWKEVKPWKRD